MTADKDPGGTRAPRAAGTHLRFALARSGPSARTGAQEASFRLELPARLNEGDGPTVLVAETDEAALEAIREWSRTEGVTPVIAGTIEAAMRVARSQCPDIAVCGAMLPDGPGASLIEQLHMINEGLPVLSLAPARAATLVAECIRAGAGGVLLRPFTMEAFRGALGKLLVRCEPQWTLRTPPQRISVLCVEDDPLTLRFTGMLLTSCGLKPALARDFGEARRALSEQRFDVVIVDAFLKAELGADLIAELRKQDPLLPLILVTGSEDPDVLTRALDVGASAVFVKPLDRDALFRTVVRLHRNDVRGQMERKYAAEVAALRACNEELEKQVAAQATAAQTPAAHAAPPPAPPALLGGALDSLPLGVAVLDAGDCVTSLNAAARMALDVGDQPVVGQPLSALTGAEPLHAAIDALRTRGLPLFESECSLTIGRSHRVISVTAARAEGGAVLAVLRDVTAAKLVDAASRQTERLATVGIIARGLIQEISNPVVHAVTTADLALRDGSLRGNTRLQVERLRFVLQRVGHLATRVSRLLENTGSQFVPCSVNDILNDVITFLDRRFFMGSHAFSNDLTAPAALVMGDPVDLEHLFTVTLASLVDTVPTGRTISVRTLNHMGILEVRIGAVQAPKSRDLLLDIPELAALEESAPDPAPMQTADHALSHCRVAVNRIGGSMRVELTEGSLSLRIRLRPASRDECIGFSTVQQGDAPMLREGTRGGQTVGVVCHRADVMEFCLAWIDKAGLRVRRYDDPGAAVRQHARDAIDYLIADASDGSAEWPHFVGRAARKELPPTVFLVDQADALMEQLLDMNRVDPRQVLRRPCTGPALVQRLALIELEGDRVRGSEVNP